MSVSKIFDMPKFYYFEAGNNYVGSLNGMSFKIENTESLKVYTYHGTKCFELSEPFQEETFPKSENGYTELINWLENTYLEHTKTEFFNKRIKLL